MNDFVLKGVVNIFLNTGLMSDLRLIGPALGYGMAGMTMRRYVNLGEKTTLKPTDPAWIGAWWLGNNKIVSPRLIFIIKIQIS